MRVFGHKVSIEQLCKSQVSHICFEKLKLKATVDGAMFQIAHVTELTMRGKQGKLSSADFRDNFSTVIGAHPYQKKLVQPSSARWFYSA